MERGFSMLEILLGIALLVLLLGLVNVGLRGVLERRALDEGVHRLATVLRMARTEAATRGRRVRIAFAAPDAETAGIVGDEDRMFVPPDDGNWPRIVVEWESDPLAEPGAFEAHTGLTWGHQIPNDLIVVRRAELVGSSRFNLSAASVGGDGASDDDEGVMLGMGGASGPSAGGGSDTEADAGPWMPITFYPDGGSDSAEIEIAPRYGSDPRVGRVTLNGLSGTIDTSVRIPREDGMGVPDE